MDTENHGAPCVLAATPPFDIDALVLAEVYRHRVEVRQRGEEPALEDIEQARTAAWIEALHCWKEALANPTAGHRTIAAFCPVLEEWVGREETPQCHHYGDPDDTADDTMVVFPAWQNERRAFTAALGGRILSLPSLVEAMIGSDEAWEAAACFAEAVMSADVRVGGDG
nr:uncharacterized protein LOC116777711 [Danaus plexippus plexippus]